MFSLFSRSLFIATLVLATAGLGNTQATSQRTPVEVEPIDRAVQTTRDVVAPGEQAILDATTLTIINVDPTASLSGTVFEHGIRVGDEEHIFGHDNGANPGTLGDPVSGVAISLDHPLHAIPDQLSDAQGEYTFADVPSNAVYVISWVGHVDHGHSVQVVVGDVPYITQKNFNSSKSNTSRIHLDSLDSPTGGADRRRQ